MRWLLFIVHLLAIAMSVHFLRAEFLHRRVHFAGFTMRSIWRM